MGSPHKLACVRTHHYEEALIDTIICVCVCVCVCVCTRTGSDSELNE